MSADGKVVEKSMDSIPLSKQRVVLCDVDGTLTVLEGQITFTPILYFHRESEFKQEKLGWMGQRVEAILGEELYQAVYVAARSDGDNVLTYLRFDLIDKSNLSDENKLAIKDKLLRRDLVEQLKQLQTKQLATLYFVTLSYNATFQSVMEHASLQLGEHFTAYQSRDESKFRLEQVVNLMNIHIRQTLGIAPQEYSKRIAPPKFVKLLTIDDSQRSLGDYIKPNGGLIAQCSAIKKIVILKPKANVEDDKIASDVKNYCQKLELKLVSKQLAKLNFFGGDDERSTEQSARVIEKEGLPHESRK